MPRSPKVEYSKETTGIYPFNCEFTRGNYYTMCPRYSL